MSTVTKSEGRRLRVFCPTHKINFSVLATNTILCVAGSHGLAENFPRGHFWGYCCNCQTYWPSTVGTGGMVEERCPVCEREVARRYVCTECNVVSFESDDKARWKEFNISESEGPLPYCPGCLSVPKTALYQHHCDDTAVSFTTGLDMCPFCDEMIPSHKESFQTHAGASPALGLNAVYQSESAASDASNGVRSLPTNVDRSVDKRRPNPPFFNRIAPVAVAAMPRKRQADVKTVGLIFGCILIVVIGVGLVLSLVNLSRNQTDNASPKRTVEAASTASSSVEKEKTTPPAPAVRLDTPPPESQNSVKTPSQTADPKRDDSESAILTLSGDVDGMEILVDGHSLGIISRNVPKRVRLTPGQHSVQAAKSGYHTWERSLSLAANASERISIELQSNGPSPQQRGEEQRQTEQPRQTGSSAPQSEGAAQRRSHGPPVEEGRQPVGAAPLQALPESPVRPSPAAAVPISLFPSVDGNYAIVSLVGRFGEPPGSAGSVDVVVSAPESATELRSVRGNLPGRPCRISFTASENVAEYSFRETPGPGNRWGKATVRVRPKDSKRPIRFSVNWELL